MTNTTYGHWEGGPAGGAYILYGGSGQTKHTRAFEMQRDLWPSKLYVDDMPVVLRLDDRQAAPACRIARIRAFAALVAAGLTVIAIVTGDRHTIDALFEEAGVDLWPAVELVEVVDGPGGYRFGDNGRPAAI